MQNNGIFKDVEHYHMHIVPRFKNDGFSWVDPQVEVEEGEFEELVFSLKLVDKA